MKKVVNANGVSLMCLEGKVGEDLMQLCGWQEPVAHTETFPTPAVLKTVILDTSDLVALVLPEGTKETEQYLKTPDWQGKERWFEKVRMAAWELVNGKYVVKMPRAAIKARGLEMLVVEV